MPSRGRRRVGAAVVALAGLLGAEALALRHGPPWADRSGAMLLGWYALAWAVFAVAAVLVLRAPRRAALALVVAGGVLVQVLAVAVAPTTTDDFYRYVWDGTVQAAGVDPYRYPPLADELTDLRDDYLFPPDARPTFKADGTRAFTDLCTYRGAPHDCTRINRPTVRTIYPPVAELYFLGLHYASPDDHRQRAQQVGAAVLALATALLLIRLLDRAGRDPRWAVLWAWCPAVFLEAGNNAHVDVLGVLLLVAALGVLGIGSPSRGAAGRGRRGWAGVLVAGGLLGAAVAVKLLPALAGPAMLGRRARWLVGGAVGVFTVGYLPHVAAVGTDVLGYLPGYLSEEGYGGQQRFAVLRLVVPDAAAIWVGALILAGVAAAVLVRCRDLPPPVGALVLTGSAFLVIGPSQPWYGLLVVGLAVLAGRAEWLAVAAAAYPVYLAGATDLTNETMQRLFYLPALGIVLAVTAARHRSSRRPPEGGGTVPAAPERVR